jgi:hypothetical protein
VAEPCHLTGVFPAVYTRRGGSCLDPGHAHSDVACVCVCVCMRYVSVYMCLLATQLSSAPITTRQISLARTQGHGKDTSITPMSSVWVPVERTVTGFRAG